MKIVTYILLGLVVVAGIFGCHYASSQSKTLQVLVSATRGLGEDETGMAAANKGLLAEAATVAKTRADALKENESSQAEAQKALEDMEAVKHVAEEDKAEMETYQSRIAEAETNREGLTNEREKIREQIRNIPGLENADLEDALDTLNSRVASGAEEYAKLAEESGTFQTKYDELKGEVSARTTELEGKNKVNEQFMERYRQNGEEFVVAAVDPQWHFVVFHAGENSGLFAGDKTQLLLQRNGISITTLRVVSVSGGQIVAEYDEKSLPRGLVPEVGDQIFRKEPLGS